MADSTRTWYAPREKPTQYWSAYSQRIIYYSALTEKEDDVAFLVVLRQPAVGIENNNMKMPGNHQLKCRRTTRAIANRAKARSNMLSSHWKMRGNLALFGTKVPIPLL
jgi:hypothetical protein